MDFDATFQKLEFEMLLFVKHVPNMPYIHGRSADVSSSARIVDSFGDDFWIALIDFVLFMLVG